MRIKLKSISLVNFKALTQNFDFCENKTKLGGKNGTGKTTLFDAFCWVLFGKSSSDKKDFSVATLDEAGNIIPDLEHKVTAVLEVDGNEVTICRTQIEKYKKDGTFKGSEQSRSVNGIPKNVSEYDAFIASLIDASLFKAVTSPYFFTALNWKVQREFLIQLVDTDKIQMPESYNALIERFKDGNIEQYRKGLNSELKKVDSEITAKKAVIKDRKSEINTSDSVDVKTLKNAISEKNNEIEGVKSEIVSIAKTLEADYKAKEAVIIETQNQLTDKKMELQAQRGQSLSAKREAYMAAEFKCQEILKEMAYTDEKIKATTQGKEAREKEVEACRQRWSEINAETLQMSEDEFVCPTCKRPLDLEDIEAKKAEMTANFNADKARRKAAQKERANNIKTEIETAENELRDLEQQKNNLESQLLEAQSDPVLQDDNFEEPQTDGKIEAEIAALEAEIAAKRNELQMSTTNSKIDELKQREACMAAELNELNRKLGEAEAIQRTADKIKILEAEKKDLEAEYVRIEGELDSIKEYQKEYFGQIENLVNSKFKLAKFKLFDTLVSGEQVEACEATYNGVPFADLNNAMKINIGLDIVNAICKSKDVYAPIFVDNAESINEIAETDSQTIALYVTNNEKLTILK